FGPSAPLGISASAGRLVSVTPTAARTAKQRAVRVASSGVLASRPGVLTPRLSSSVPPDPSGGHSVHLVQSAGQTYAVVQDDDTVIKRYPVPGCAYSVVESGQWILVTMCGADPTLDDGYGTVINLDTDERIRVPETVALYGDSVAYLKHTGEIRLRDFVT